VPFTKQGQPVVRSRLTDRETRRRKSGNREMGGVWWWRGKTRKMTMGWGVWTWWWVLAGKVSAVHAEYGTFPPRRKVAGVTGCHAN
jgi:hypothetical protein